MVPSFSSGEHLWSLIMSPVSPLSATPASLLNAAKAAIREFDLDVEVQLVGGELEAGGREADLRDLEEMIGGADDGGVTARHGGVPMGWRGWSATTATLVVTAGLLIGERRAPTGFSVPLATIAGEYTEIPRLPKDMGRLDMYGGRAEGEGANAVLYGHGTMYIRVTERGLHAALDAYEAESAALPPSTIGASAGHAAACGCARCARETREGRDFLRTYVGA